MLDSHGRSCRSDDRLIFGWLVTDDRFEIITSNIREEE